MTADLKLTYQSRILNTLIYIQNHLDDQLSLEKLASEAFFSPYHFHRIFTAYTGESIKGYIRRLRLVRATSDLAFTDMTIVRVAERAGYDTQQSFHRAFKEAYDQTPKAYRDHAKINLSLASEKKSEKLGLPEVSMAEIKKQIEIKQIAPIKVAFIRHIGTYEKSIETWFQLVSAVGMGTILSPATQKISIAYDTPDITPADKLRFDACVTLENNPDLKPKGQLGIQTLHGGKYAIITHHGALEKIDNTYKTLYGIWLPNSGYEPADFPNFIVHRKLPFKTLAKSLITDIYLPIK